MERMYPLAGLNELYGVNCYANAIGRCTPRYYIGQIANVPTVCYLYTTPGKPEDSKVQAQAQEKRDFEGFVAAVRAGCSQDGLVSVGQTFAQEPGYKTAALFFDKAEVDYHFAVFEDTPAPLAAKSLWRSKVPREPFLRLEGIPEIA